jgi:hypothetical protein
LGFLAQKARVDSGQNGGYLPKSLDACPDMNNQKWQNLDFQQFSDRVFGPARHKFPYLEGMEPKKPRNLGAIRTKTAKTCPDKIRKIRVFEI